jgi:hypothetical protein
LAGPNGIARSLRFVPGAKFEGALTGHFASHAADAWRYLALAWREPVPPDEELDPIAELLKPKTLNDWWQQHVDEQIELGADPEAFGEDLTFI